MNCPHEMRKRDTHPEPEKGILVCADADAMARDLAQPFAQELDDGSGHINVVTQINRILLGLRLVDLNIKFG